MVCKALWVLFLTPDALGGSSCHHPHITEEKTEVSKCQETCLSSTWIAQMESKTENQKRRVGLTRPSRISPAENLESHSLPICTIHIWGLVGAGLCLHIRGTMIFPESDSSCVCCARPPLPQINADRAGRRAYARTSRFPASFRAS